MKERKSNNNNNNNNYNAGSDSTRTVDREYYANQETSRNKWFNYTDPYYLNNDQLKNYQENTSQSQQYQYSDKQNNGSQQNHQSSSNTQNSEYYNSQNNSQNHDGLRQGYNSSGKNTGKLSQNDTHMGSTTDYTDFALSNQYPHSSDSTPIPEPFTDTESHVNFNTAPHFAGDNQYGSYTRTQENSNTYTSDESYASNYNNDNNEDCYRTKSDFDSCDADCDCGCNSKDNSKNNPKHGGGMK